MPSLLALTDVLATGHHAALAANVGSGKTVAVVGDGAVGLCGVIPARRLGAERIIILGRHPDRVALAEDFGATDVVSERGDEAVERMRELTDGFGAHSVLECVGLEQSTVTALSAARPGGAVGRVGVPQAESIPEGATTFFDNVTIAGACSGACVHRRAAAGRFRRKDRTRSSLRPRHEPRRGARRLPGDERPRSDQGDDRLLMAVATELRSPTSADWRTHWRARPSRAAFSLQAVSCGRSLQKRSGPAVQPTAQFDAGAAPSAGIATGKKHAMRPAEESYI